ncbi:MAG: hypothetical protein H7176_14885 [Bdellovibrionales bacterium]|nr:hypothetical protein [Massilia sp.]
MDSPTINLKERTGFSARLKSALDGKNLSARPSDVARAFNARADGCAVTSHAARKWLVGESIPTQERILVISKWLNVNASWLRFGEAENATLLAARGLENVLVTKGEYDLVQGVLALSKRSQAVLQDLVFSLLKLESDSNTQMSAGASRGGNKRRKAQLTDLEAR